MIQRLWLKRRQTFQNTQRGQSLVEYVLVIWLAIGVSLMMNQTLKRGIRGFWFTLASDIAAPCKGCTVPPAITAR
jgi:hypothetical protein